MSTKKRGRPAIAEKNPRIPIENPTKEEIKVIEWIIEHGKASTRPAAVRYAIKEYGEKHGIIE